MKLLTIRNQNLTTENNKLRNYIDTILDVNKKFSRKILQFGNDYVKYKISIEVKDCYNNEGFNMTDVVKLSIGTTKQDELFQHVNTPDYLKERITGIGEYEKEYDKSDNFDIY